MKEAQNIEWKESWRDEYLRWICGFANAEGGVLHLGRNDRGVVVGLPNAAKLLEEIPNKVRDILGIVVKVNLRTTRGREWLEVVVEPYPYPISYRGEYHVRSGSTKQELRGAALDRFLLRKQGRTWDATPVPGVSPRDLSRTALAAFRKLAKDSRRLDSTVLREPAAGLLDKLNLLEGGHLKRAAVLIFHPDPERFITGAFVKLGFFRTESGLLYHDEVRGDLFMQTRQTMDLLLTKYLKAAISYRGIHRVEALPVPEAALREAVLNAVIHKDYASHSPVQIRVYADKLKIWNPGLLPENWSVENLLGEHASRPFNPAVANAFFRAGEIEAWGRGIERILSACKAEGTPAPLIRYQPNDLWLEFPFSRAYIETMSGPGGGLAPTPGQTTGTTPKTTPKTTLETTLETTLNTTQRILAILLSHPAASRREIAARLGDITEDGVKYQLHKLRQAGTIRHVGPAKGGRWEVLP